ncbi:MAG: CD1375 family protein [Pseudoflavonifractor sp.]
MAKIYFRKIKGGSMSIEEVPERWRDATQALLSADEAARATEVTMYAPTAKTPAEATQGATVNIFDSMTVAQLKEYATTNGIDLGGATLKADIRAVVKATAVEV